MTTEELMDRYLDTANPHLFDAVAEAILLENPCEGMMSRDEAIAYIKEKLAEELLVALKNVERGKPA